MWYGFSRKDIVNGFVIFIVIGIVAAVFGLVAGFINNDPGPRNYWALLFLVFAIPAIWLVLVSIFTITWIKVGDYHIEWYLWKKVRLLSCPIADITHIGAGSFSALVIKTNKKGTIRLFGLHIRDRIRLSDHLMEINENIQWL